jgi:hypothetical protein
VTTALHAHRPSSAATKHSLAKKNFDQPFVREPCREFYEEKGPKGIRLNGFTLTGQGSAQNYCPISFSPNCGVPNGNSH